MITFFRHLFVDSWLGRVFALLLFSAFILWGLGDFLTSMGRGDAGTVATVGSQKVTTQALQTALRQQLAQVAQQTTGGDVSQIPAAERSQIALQVLQGLVSRAEALREAGRLGLSAPDAVLRQTIFDAPTFQGQNGQFERPRFDQWLTARGMTEAQLLSALRDDLVTSALIAPLRAGAKAPAILVRRAYDYAAETRTLDMVRVAFAPSPAPPSAGPPSAGQPNPDEALLHRYFDNHKDQFQAPEYRKARFVLLSAETIARSIEVPEARERALFAAQNGDGKVPEKRSVEVITAPSQARAAALATLWNGGAAWPQMQAASADSVPVAIDDTTEATFPDPALGRLAFAAASGEVAGPVHLESGWALLKVVKVTAARSLSFEQMRPALHDQIAVAAAREGLGERIRKLQDAIAGGRGLEQIPADLGAAAAEGTLDAHGLTLSGEPAPLPGSEALRQAMIAQVFAAKAAAPPELKEGPDSALYAVYVEQVTPAQALDYATVRDKVRSAVQHDLVRRAAESQAASLFARIRDHGGLAASGRGDVIASGPIGRDAAPQNLPPGVPASLARLAFGLAPGASTMQEVADGFVVATLTGVQHPDASANRLALARLQSNLDGAIGDDIEASYAMALRDRTKPVLNSQAVRSVVGQ